MSKFKKKNGKDTPAISTASLPDIIFMLLFFFMVTTVMREGEQKVKINTPTATELTKLEQKSLVNHLLVGKPLDSYQEKYGTKVRLQLDDKFADLEDIPLFIEKHRQKIDEKRRGKIISSLKVDGDVKMGYVSDIKTELRKQNQLKLNYSAKKGEVK